VKTDGSQLETAEGGTQGAFVVSRRIRQLRYAKGWGPDDLAARAKISRTALYQIESGKTEHPRAGTLRRIARALGVEPSVLFEAPVEGPTARDSAVGSGPSPMAAGEITASLLRDFELERKFRKLLASPLRDAVSRIVDESYRLLGPDAAEGTS
jgi:transcriptional regulator with XRE-family HTH domain